MAAELKTAVVERVAWGVQDEARVQRARSLCAVRRPWDALAEALLCETDAALLHAATRILGVLASSSPSPAPPRRLAPLRRSPAANVAARRGPRDGDIGQQVRLASAAARLASRACGGRVLAALVADGTPTLHTLTLVRETLTHARRLAAGDGGATLARDFCAHGGLASLCAAIVHARSGLLLAEEERLNGVWAALRPLVRQRGTKRALLATSVQPNSRSPALAAASVLLPNVPALAAAAAASSCPPPHASLCLAASSPLPRRKKTLRQPRLRHYMVAIDEGEERLPDSKGHPGGEEEDENGWHAAQKQTGAEIVLRALVAHLREGYCDEALVLLADLLSPARWPGTPAAAGPDKTDHEELADEIVAVRALAQLATTTTAAVTLLGLLMQRAQRGSRAGRGDPWPAALVALDASARLVVALAGNTTRCAALLEPACALWVLRPRDPYVTAACADLVTAFARDPLVVATRLLAAPPPTLPFDPRADPHEVEPHRELGLRLPWPPALPTLPLYRLCQLLRAYRAEVTNETKRAAATSGESDSGVVGTALIESPPMLVDWLLAWTVSGREPPRSGITRCLHRLMRHCARTGTQLARGCVLESAGPGAWRPQIASPAYSRLLSALALYQGDRPRL